MTNKITICVCNTELKTIHYIESVVRPNVGDYIPINNTDERVDKVVFPVGAADLIGNCDLIVYVK